MFSVLAGARENPCSAAGRPEPCGSRPGCRCRETKGLGRRDCLRQCGCTPRSNINFDAGAVQRFDHLLEFMDHVARILTIGRIIRVQGEESQRVVAPIVAQPLVDQMAVVHEIMHRHQLERRDA